MSNKTKWIALAAGVLVLGGGIGRAIVHKKAQQSELAQSSASAQAPQMTLTSREVMTIQPTPLTHTIAISGSLSAQRSAIVKAKVAAELLSLKVREGDHVKADQVIGKLDPQEFDTRLQQARQQAATAKAQWQIAQQNLDNNQALIAQGFISRNALDTSLSNAAGTKAAYEAAQAAVDLASKALKDSTVRAPIAGQISQRFVQAGERVAVDGRIVEVVDLNSLELQAPLSPQDVTQVRVGSPATLHLDGLSEAVTARIARINPSATADTRSVMVYLALPSHPALRQGLFAQGEIMLAQRDALAVPLSAITRESGRDQVLRVSQGKVSRVNVKLGTHSGKSPDGQPMQEVVEGLQAGDMIVRNASGTVHDGQAVKLEQPAAATR
ncbi:MAG TPA: efflux RND transporter periplasmic adaptor subunit [Aquabacterium sp.]|uniref:efflux RND transporter periplasmic adaptor subunit n=1 Tax=Aquabacterium sp. TaxID=1872578 RepID=UPI002E311EBE|nr:efflux RND transporter periplasmic adaptor subunit [Aquabacterium sp.]HEX5358085.1 efflux RND transporter periplasmic adaptor subunit [Aquabacterium sp.]